MTSDSTQRFSNRVENYVLYRPSYPADAMDLLYSTLGFSADSAIADIGSGTGISTRLFLERGSTVYAVEPNSNMRSAAEKSLSSFANFHSVDATAESTTLPAASVDYVVCAQAFHWFDRPACAREFHRILRPQGKVVLMWNDRLTTGTPFLEAYEQLLVDFCPEYKRVDHKNIGDKEFREFFLNENYEQREFDNEQQLTFEQLQGRLLSSSYAPVAGEPQHAPMLHRLNEIFEAHQRNGRVSFAYRTRLYWGSV